jgi:hypothetical protein
MVMMAMVAMVAMIQRLEWGTKLLQGKTLDRRDI